MPPDLFADVAPVVVNAWRARAAVESPSHLREHPQPTKLALLCALRKIAEASLKTPDDTVREVIYPVVGGEATLTDLVNEYRATGTEYQRQKRKVFKASYTPITTSRPDPPARRAGVSLQ